MFAPIIQGHALVPYGLPTSWSYWEPHAKQHIQRCDELVVLTLDGWENSEGAQAEIAIAHALHKQVSAWQVDTSPTATPSPPGSGSSVKIGELGGAADREIFVHKVFVSHGK